ncbi:MAG: xanthine dehydrogenase accessory protein XdhC [Pseudomonadota bacterium]
MSLDRAALAAAVDAHGMVARVVVAAHAGSTPRETGTAMLVWADGQAGTIGGGALEFDAVARARERLSGGAGPLLLKQPLGPALGQCCGGAVSLVIEIFTAQSLAAIPQAGGYARAVSDAPEPLGVRNWFRAQRGGRAPEPALIDGWLVEPLEAPRAPVWIYGAGHVGRALVGTFAGLPFAVTWVDDARTRFPDTIPTHADMLVAAKPAAAVAHAPDTAHHLVLSYSHALDLEICHAVLSRPFASLGLIGSATKRARFLSRLADLGHRPEWLARLTCPIGDPGLGKHPQAIAVGVVHRLLKDAAATGAATEGHVA